MQPTKESPSISKPTKTDNFVPEDDKENVPIISKPPLQSALAVKSSNAPAAGKDNQPLEENKEMEEEIGGGGGSKREVRSKTRGKVFRLPITAPPASTRVTRSRVATDKTRGTTKGSTKQQAIQVKEDPIHIINLCSDDDDPKGQYHEVQEEMTIEADLNHGDAPSKLHSPVSLETETHAPDEVLCSTLATENISNRKSAPPPSPPTTRLKRIKGVRTARNQQNIAATASKPTGSPPTTTTHRQTRSRVKRGTVPLPNPSSPLLSSSRKRVCFEVSSPPLARSTRWKDNAPSTIALHHKRGPCPTTVENVVFDGAPTERADSPAPKQTPAISMTVNSPAQDSTGEIKSQALEVNALTTHASPNNEAEPKKRSHPSNTTLAWRVPPLTTCTSTALPVLCHSTTPQNKGLTSKHRAHPGSSVAANVHANTGTTDSDDSDTCTYYTPLAELPVLGEPSVTVSTLPQPVASVNSSDSEFSSWLQAEVRRGCSSSRGKRLRSVSLERISLEDMQSKRSSLHSDASEDKISGEGCPLVAT